MLLPSHTSHLEKSSRVRTSAPGQRGYEEFKLFCGQLDALAFLPIDDIPAGMLYLREITPPPPHAEPLVDYFDQTYVTGTYTTVFGLAMVHLQSVPDVCHHASRRSCGMCVRQPFRVRPARTTSVRGGTTDSPIRWDTRIQPSGC